MWWNQNTTCFQLFTSQANPGHFSSRRCASCLLSKVLLLISYLPMLARSTSAALLVLVAVLIWPFDSRTNPASIWIVGSFHHRETKLPRKTLAATPSRSSAPSPSHPFPACLRSALSRRPSLISAALPPSPVQDCTSMARLSARGEAAQRRRPIPRLCLWLSADHEPERGCGHGGGSLAGRVWWWTGGYRRFLPPPPSTSKSRPHPRTDFSNICLLF
jgi:hypothetical protein